MNTQRPPSVTIAIVLLAILSLGNLLTPLMPGGAPASAIFLLAVLGVLGLIGAAGLWAKERRSSARLSQSGCSPTSPHHNLPLNLKCSRRSPTESARSCTSSPRDTPTLPSRGSSI
jgi:hypothetical protein